MENKDLSAIATSVGVFEQIKLMGHEQVVLCNDPQTGLNAIIAIHNTVLGPALGGTRMWEYVDDYAALIDALRLSQGMTYKAAVSGLNLGGGKAVIIGNPRKDKSEGLFRRYGKFVESLNGKYITAEDVGTTKEDMIHIHTETSHVAGLPEYLGGGGDPSPFTALGVFCGMKASAQRVYGSDSLSGKKVLVQGTGNVGSYLVDHLVREGAIVTITDIYEDQIKRVTDKHSKVNVIADPNSIYDFDCDIYAPCALGATLNDDTISQLKCSIISGGANNQLKDTVKHGKMLVERGILYAPDFVINAGGLINVYTEIHGYNADNALAKTEKIYDTTLQIFKRAQDENITTHQAAVKIAEERINIIRHINSVL